MTSHLLTVFLFVSALFAGAANEAEYLLFHEDASPSGEGHRPEAISPGWDPAESGDYPGVVWVEAPLHGPAEGNGYFTEGRRPAGSVENLFLQSHSLEVGDLKGRAYQLSFDFKVGPHRSTAEAGILDFRALYWTEGGGWQWENLRLFDDGQVVGDNGVALENTFDEVVVTGPDTRGWRSVRVVGAFKSDSAMRLWVAPWTFENADPTAGHFSGTWGIDNVSLSVDLPEFQIPVGVELIRAIEVEFHGDAGQTYRIESSADQVDWVTEIDGIAGADRPVHHHFPASPRRTYRVIQE